MDDDDRLVAGSLLRYLQPEERDFLIKRGARRSFAENELLLRQGDPTDHVLVLLAGWVRVYSSTADGHEVLLALRGPGDVIGELAALHGWLRTASVRTLENVRVVQLTAADFIASVYERPGIALAMIKQMSMRMREAETARVDSATLDVTRRVALHILRLAQQHGVNEPSGLTLRMPLTQQDIANRVGASRRAVARAIAVLRDRHILTTGRRRIVINQPDVLRLFSRAEPSPPE